MQQTAESAVVTLVEEQLLARTNDRLISDIKHVHDQSTSDSDPVLRVWVTDRVAKQELKSQLHRLESPIYIDLRVE